MILGVLCLGFGGENAGFWVGVPAGDYGVAGHGVVAWVGIHVEGELEGGYGGDYR